MNTLTIGDRKCLLFEDPDASDLLIQPTGDHETASLEEEVRLIGRLRGGRPFSFAAFPAEDWNRQLSPWEAPAVFGSEGFGDGAAETLKYITDTLLPCLRERSSCDTLRIFLGGYSLAGLFSLWAAYQTDSFHGIAAVSPSVWFPGWIGYAGQNTIKSERVYLSLGDREMKTKNQIMSTVGDCIQRQYDLLASSGTCACTLEWNPGNHFREPALRTVKGFAWL